MQIEKIKPVGEISVCPACGYTDGFHVSFQMAENHEQGEIILVCPDCHRRFQLGWKITLSGE